MKKEISAKAVDTLIDAYERMADDLKDEVINKTISSQDKKLLRQMIIDMDIQYGRVTEDPFADVRHEFPEFEEEIIQADIRMLN